MPELRRPGRRTRPKLAVRITLSQGTATESVDTRNWTDSASTALPNFSVVDAYESGVPPTTYHVALAGLLTVPFLGRYLDLRSFAVVAAATAFPDLDGVVEVWWTGAHRTLLHNLLLPLAVSSLLIWDLYLREPSYVRQRYGGYGVRVCWTALTALVVAAILADAFHNGANLLWPLRDEFYEFTGSIYYSTEEGLVVESLRPEAIGGTSDVHLYTGVDMQPGDDPAGVERIFVFAEDGQQLLLTVVGYAAVAWMLLWNRRDRDEATE